ncbi:MAG: hypothetical protein V2I33_21965, partial [Kangiellaceae bacterium]|nr:hypothetical protein [Kangiellaceae bacterium]
MLRTLTEESIERSALLILSYLSKSNPSPLRDFTLSMIAEVSDAIMSVEAWTLCLRAPNFFEIACLTASSASSMT